MCGSNPAVAAALSPCTRLFIPLSQGEAFTLASISYLAILVKYILAKKTFLTKSTLACVHFQVAQLTNYYFAVAMSYLVILIGDKAHLRAKRSINISKMWVWWKARAERLRLVAAVKIFIEPELHCIDWKYIKALCSDNQDFRARWEGAGVSRKGLSHGATSGKRSIIVRFWQILRWTLFLTTWSFLFFCRGPWDGPRIFLASFIFCCFTVFLIGKFHRVHWAIFLCAHSW